MYAQGPGGNGNYQNSGIFSDVDWDQVARWGDDVSVFLIGIDGHYPFGDFAGLGVKGSTRLLRFLFKTKALPRSGPIIRSVGGASRAEMLAIKLKLNINSPTTRQVLNSLDDTVDNFISQFRKSSIRSEIPGEFLNMTIEQALKSGNTTVRKLLIDSRFVK